MNGVDPDVAVAAAAPLPVVPGLDAPHVSAALDFGKSSTQLEAFCEELRTHPVARIDDFFVCESVSRDDTIRCLHRLRLLSAELAAAPLSPLRIFRLRQTPLLFPSLAGLSIDELEQCSWVDDFYLLPKLLGQACKQQTAALTLVARGEQAKAAGTVLDGTFLDRLSANAELGPLVDAATTELDRLMSAVKSQPACTQWRTSGGPGRDMVFAGLTGEVLAPDTSDTLKAYYACGCLLAEAEMPWDVLPRAGSGSVETKPECRALQIAAALLGRVGVLQAMRTTLGWDTANEDVVRAAAEAGQDHVVRWAIEGADDATKPSLAGFMSEGAFKRGAASLPLLRWYVEGLGGSPKHLQYTRQLWYLLLQDAESLVLFDYVFSFGGPMLSLSEQITLFARVGDADRLRAAVARARSERVDLPREIVECAMSNGHTALAEELLVSGDFRWEVEFEALASVCRGYKGDVGLKLLCMYVGMLEHGIARGCPATAEAFPELIDAASELGYTDVLAWAAAHPSFPGWLGTFNPCGIQAARGAVVGNRAEVFDWLQANSVDGAKVKNDPYSRLPDDLMVLAVESGSIELVRRLHAWGWPFGSALFVAHSMGDACADIVAFIRANTTAIAEAAWRYAGKHFGGKVTKEAIDFALEAYSMDREAFLLGARTNIAAFEFAHSRGLIDVLMCARQALLLDNAQVMRWMFDRLPEQTRALPLQETLDEISEMVLAAPPDATMKWLRRVQGIHLEWHGLRVYDDDDEDNDDDG